MDCEFVKIAENEDAEIMELPVEENQTVLLSTIQAQFPNAIGLKYKGETGCWRGIRANENILDAPRDGWADTVYYVTVNESLKRKNGSAISHGQPKIIKSTVDPLLQDIAVLSLPFKVTDEELSEYFTTSCGELAYSEVKVDRDTKKSRGFGFIRFKNLEDAEKAVNSEHFLHGRKLMVKPKRDPPMKVFVGRLPRETTKDDLTNYFSEFGELKDVYIPTPFRGFGFITFASTEVGRAVLAEQHTLHGSVMNLEERKTENINQKGERGFNGTTRQSRGVSGYGGGDRYNPKIPSQNDDPSADLKNMLFSFLVNQSKPQHSY